MMKVIETAEKTAVIKRTSVCHIASKVGPLTRRFTARGTH